MPKVTINELARMVAEGFTHIDERFDTVERRLDIVEGEVKEINRKLDQTNRRIDIIIPVVDDHSRRIKELEIKVT